MLGLTTPGASRTSTLGEPNQDLALDSLAKSDDLGSLVRTMPEAGEREDKRGPHIHNSKTSGRSGTLYPRIDLFRCHRPPETIPRSLRGKNTEQFHTVQDDHRDRVLSGFDLLAYAPSHFR